MIRISKVPAGYQEVKYIESSGTQYISTGVTPTSKTGINLDYSYNTISSSTPAGISGVYQPSSPRTDTLFVTTNSGKTNSTIMLISRGKSIDAGIVPTANTKYNAKINWLNDGKINFNNGQVETTNGTNNIVSRETILFGRYYNGSNAYTSARIYKCQFSEDGNIIRDLIPCYRKSDDEIGMYDIVGKTFYTNAGTGNFIKGDDVGVIDAITIGGKDVKKIEDINGNVWWSSVPPTPVNLFDPTTAVIMESYFQTGQSSIASSSANRMSYIECKPNTTYEISKLLGKVFWVGYTTQLPANGVAVSGITQGTQNTFDGTTRTSLDFTTGSNATYLVFRYTQIYMDGSANADTIKNSIEIYEK